MFPLVVRRLVRPLAVQPLQLLPCRRLIARFLRQPRQKTLVAFPRLPRHDRAQGRVRFQRAVVQPQAQKTPQRQRVLSPSGHPPLRVQPLEIPDQQQPEIHPRHQARPPTLPLPTESPAAIFHRIVEAARLQRLVQALMERMTRTLRRRPAAAVTPPVALGLSVDPSPRAHSTGIGSHFIASPGTLAGLALYHALLETCPSNCHDLANWTLAWSPSFGPPFLEVSINSSLSSGTQPAHLRVRAANQASVRNAGRHRKSDQYVSH